MNFFPKRHRKGISGESADIGARMRQLKEELDRAKERLEQLNDVKSNFVSVISHELRTPLTSIKEGVSLLLDRALGDLNPRQEEFLRIVKRNTDRLTRLVNDLLDLSRLETGGVRFKKGATSIEPLIGSIEASLAPLLSQKKMRLVTHFPKELPPVYVDAGRVRQVLGHLLENALKFAEQPGEVVLEAALCPEGDWGSWKDARYVKISVKDHGMGIPSDQIHKLFNKFEQLHRKVGPGAQGTGLGLSICRQIIERHGGRIWIESSQGKGTVCSLTLPVYSETLELLSIFEEYKLDAALERNPLLIIIFSLPEDEEFHGERLESLRGFLESQIRSSDRLFYYPRENAFYLFVVSERPAELSLLERIQKSIKHYLRSKAVAWSFYPEDGQDMDHLKQKAFQRAEAA
ncbi:MAG: HAMP domain-containing histidine kinase [Candidatus Omnitrophica bacterium]|nr:HAMP domain-containing histidine kinase [Candidatus Omnitrophota bacterium]